MLLFADQITPTGLQDGSNQTYTLPYIPAPAASLELTYNGQRMKQDVDYTISANVFQYLYVYPISTDVQSASFRYNGPPSPGGLLTAQDYIYMALRKCGQLRPGYTGSAELLNDGLMEWTSLFDAYNAKRTMQYTMPDYVYDVTGAGHGTTGNGQTFSGSGYQIGPSALDFIGPRPNVIVRMNLYMTSASPTEPTRIPMSQISMEEWMNISVIAIPPINVATVFAYDPQWPNGVIWVWPPLNGNSLEIFTWGFLTPPASLTSLYSAPPGYSDVIIWELAKRLWPMITKDIAIHKVSHQWLCGQALKARQDVMAVNAPSPRMSNDFSGGHPGVGVSDWQLLLTGQPY